MEELIEARCDIVKVGIEKQEMCKVLELARDAIEHYFEFKCPHSLGDVLTAILNTLGGGENEQIQTGNDSKMR